MRSLIMRGRHTTPHSRLLCNFSLDRLQTMYKPELMADVGAKSSVNSTRQGDSVLRCLCQRPVATFHIEVWPKGPSWAKSLK